MFKLDGLTALVAVVEAGSITEAARRMGIAKSVLSERLADLERSLGTRLLQRTTRKVSVTEDGSAFLERARRIVRDASDAAAEMAERRGTLAGPLRLSAPVSFGSLHLGPAIYPFLEANPGIELTLELDDRFVDVAADGYDAVVRHGEDVSSGSADKVRLPVGGTQRDVVIVHQAAAQAEVHVKNTGVKSRFLWLLSEQFRWPDFGRDQGIGGKAGGEQ